MISLKKAKARHCKDLPNWLMVRGLVVLQLILSCEIGNMMINIKKQIGILIPSFPKQVSDTLVSAIVTMSEIPEIRLGSEDQGSFDPERIARITSRWVNGTPLYEIAHDEYGGDVVSAFSISIVKYRI